MNRRPQHATRTVDTLRVSYITGAGSNDPQPPWSRLLILVSLHLEGECDRQRLVDVCHLIGSDDAGAGL